MTVDAPLTPHDPRPWFLAMLKALAGLQRGDTTDATAYLRAVEACSGRDTAEVARAGLKQRAQSPAFSHAHLLLADALAGRALGNYAPKSPPAKHRPTATFSPFRTN